MLYRFAAKCVFISLLLCADIHCEEINPFVTITKSKPPTKADVVESATKTVTDRALVDSTMPPAKQIEILTASHDYSADIQLCYVGKSLLGKDDSLAIDALFKAFGKGNIDATKYIGLYYYQNANNSVKALSKAYAYLMVSRLSPSDQNLKNDTISQIEGLLRGNLASAQDAAGKLYFKFLEYDFHMPMRDYSLHPQSDFYCHQ